MANSLITPPEVGPGRETPAIPVGGDAAAPRAGHGAASERRNRRLHVGLPRLQPPGRLPERQVRPLTLESKPAENDLILEEEGVFSSLWGSVRDVFFPKKLPPLVLESKPIAVIDRMAVKRDPRSTAIAVAFYAVVIGLLWYFQSRIMKFVQPPKQMATVEIQAPPPIAPPKAVRMGGGGGQRGPAPVSKGSPPKFDPVQIVPPKAPPLEQPKIAVVPTIDVQKDVKMASNMPNIGMPNAPTVGVSMGNGNGSGLGSGNGNGMGPGSGGNLRRRRPPDRRRGPASLLAAQVEPEFSEEARKAKVGGNVLVYMIVDAQGRPRNIKVLRGLGMGLDEKAIEAMQAVHLPPRHGDGKAVPVELQVEVNFQIF